MAMSEIFINYNDGIGFLPVSLFVVLNEEKFTLDELYKKIISWGCHDIIFCGKIEDYQNELSWLIPKLMSDAFHCISVMFRLENVVPIVARRVIIRIKTIQKKYDIIKSLTENDILILEEDNIERLFRLKQNLLKITEIPLFYNEDYIERKDVLKRETDEKSFKMIPIKLSEKITCYT